MADALGPLDGIRVIDLAGESGLFAGRLLGELGADVIRVEPPEGDGSRRRRPFLGGDAGGERSAAPPPLTAVNTAILKHAPNVTGCAMALEELFRAAGYPEHVFRTLVVDVPAVDSVIRDHRIKAVTLTGSNRAGEAVAAAAGATIKKTVLELGGSDPAVILADADVAAAAAACTTSRLLNAGQSCIAAKRLIVVDDVREEFEAQLV